MLVITDMDATLRLFHLARELVRSFELPIGVRPPDVIGKVGQLGSEGHILTIGVLAQDLPVAVLHPRGQEIAEERRP